MKQIKIIWTENGEYVAQERIRFDGQRYWIDGEIYHEDDIPTTQINMFAKMAEGDEITIRKEAFRT